MPRSLSLAYQTGSHLGPADVAWYLGEEPVLECGAGARS